LPQYIIKHFNQLQAVEVYKILQLRNAVFIMEQTCFYQDLDDKDLDCYHLLVLENEQIIGYARLLPIGLSYQNYCSIGRVLILPEFRKHRYGKQLMLEAIAFCKTQFACGIKISAQQYLENFYTNLGFTVCGEMYLEDEIPHLPMKL
jgi:ElaA protein